MRRLQILSALTVLAVAAQPTDAAIIQCGVSGTVTTSGGGGVSVGDNWSFVFTYDDTTVDSDAVTWRGVYENAITRYRMFVNGALYAQGTASSAGATDPTNTIQVRNLNGANDVLFVTINDPGTMTPFTLKFGPVASTIADDGIDGLKDLRSAGGTGGNFGELSVAGGLWTSSNAAVPEPATMTTLGLVFAVGGMARRRRRKAEAAE